nr:hypothetical protein [Tanacetum cinerariifolium]
EPSSPFGDDSQGEACPTVSGLEAEQDRANIIKTSTFPHDSPPRVTSLAADEGSLQHKLNELMDLCTRLQRIEMEEMMTHLEKMPQLRGEGWRWEEASIERGTKKGSDDTKEMVNVLTSLDETSVLSSRVQVSVPSAAEFATVSVHPATISVPTGSDVVPTASLIFTTATVTTPYSRRKGKEKMVESEMPKKKKLQEQIHVQMARQLEEEIEIDAQRMNEQIEYEQFAVELSILERIELINDLVKYQDNYAKFLKYQIQQRKPLLKKQQKEFYMLVLRSHAGWKTRHFKGMSLEEIKEKFVPVWKQIEDFVTMGSKEEGERFKRKRISLEQESTKKLWALVKETLNIRQAANDKEKELWVELKRLFESDVEDQLWTHT